MLRRNLSKCLVPRGGIVQYRAIHGTHTFDHNRDAAGAKVGEVVLTTKHGAEVLLDPLLNKGTGFPYEERERLGLRGLVPSRVYPSGSELRIQVQRVMDRFFQLPSAIAKYSYLIALQDRNEVLFYCCLRQYLDELAPIIYTPTVGLACQSYSSIFRRPRGMYFSADDRGHMHAMAFNWPTDDVDVIVVTDGSRILGLGDLGANGMGIPIGKLSLYVAAAGIHPSKTLPVLIDVGTNNKELLKDPMYLGLPQPRLSGDEYMEVIDEFICAMRKRFPHALLHFEDFSNENAYRLLDKYRRQMLCFNDDIQGTGCVALAGLLGSLRVVGHRDPGRGLIEQRIIVVGAGSAGLGVAGQILFAMMQEGLSEAEARKRLWIYDVEGALGKGRVKARAAEQKWVREDTPDKLPLAALIDLVKPTALLGLTGVGGLFTEEAIRKMAAHTPRPIIFPLSNPTDKAECTARQAYEWTEGRAVFASGSPFDPVSYNGRTLTPQQSNNMYMYPGIGLGALTCRARVITDKMLYQAALGLAKAVAPSDIEAGLFFPLIRDIPYITVDVAVALMRAAVEEGVAQVSFTSEDHMRALCQQRIWDPAYGSLVRVDRI